MKRIICILPLLALVMLCSCGVRSTDTGKTPEKDVEVATGSAITAVFKNSETTEKTDTWANDFIYIEEAYNDYWVLTNLDGTEEQKLKIGDEYMELWWLTNDWVYYATASSFDEEGNADGAMICRIPVDCETQPAVFDWEHKEILVEDTCYPDDLMVTDSYIFYCGYDRETNSAHGYRYDFKTKENTLVFEVKDDYCEIAYAADYSIPLVAGDEFFLLGEEKLYAVSLNTLEYKAVVVTDEGIEDSILVEYEGAVYFVPGEADSIYKYDGDTTSCLTTDTAFHKAVKGMDLVDKNASDIDLWIYDIRVIGDRLYVIVDVEWKSKEKYVEGPHKGETVQPYHGRHVLLSTDINDCSEWTLDDTLAEYMLNNFERDMYVYDTCGLSQHRYAPYKTDAKDTVALCDIDELSFTDKDQVCIWTSDDDGEKDICYYYDIATEKIRQADADIDY